MAVREELEGARANAREAAAASYGYFLAGAGAIAALVVRPSVPLLPLVRPASDAVGSAFLLLHRGYNVDRWGSTASDAVVGAE